VTEAAAGQQHSKKSLDLVQLRDLLGELVQRKDADTLLEVVFGVLLKAEKVIEDESVEIQQLRKQLFGRRSEKLSPDQLSLFAQMLATVTAPQVEAPSDPDGPATTPNKKKRKKTPRRPLIPTQSHEIPIPEGERDCPQCGGPRHTFDHARSLVIEYTPPKIDVIEYLREKVVCRSCEGEISVAPAPVERVIDGALPGPQLLAALTVNKTVDGLPLNRTQKIFARSGLDIPIQTLNRWEGYSHQLLAPVIALIRSTVQSCDTTRHVRSATPPLVIAGCLAVPGAVPGMLTRQRADSTQHPARHADPMGVPPAAPLAAKYQPRGSWRCRRHGERLCLSNAGGLLWPRRADEVVGPSHRAGARTCGRLARSAHPHRPRARRPAPGARDRGISSPAAGARRGLPSDSIPTNVPDVFVRGEVALLTRVEARVLVALRHAHDQLGSVHLVEVFANIPLHVARDVSSEATLVRIDELEDALIEGLRGTRSGIQSHSDLRLRRCAWEVGPRPLWSLPS
jgi:transposase